MNRFLTSLAAILAMLAIPTSAAAEFRRIEIKTLGMD